VKDAQVDDEKMIISRKRKGWVLASMLVLGGAITLIAIVGIILFGLEALEGRRVEDFFKAWLVLLLGTTLAYGVYFYEIRVFPDRVERIRFGTTTIPFDQIDHVYLDDLKAERINVVPREGGMLSVIRVYHSVEDWRLLGAVLLEVLPDSVEVKGSEELKAELEGMREEAREVIAQADASA
jgi:hypothetical protein